MSMTSFIDNVAVLAIENCLVQPLKSIFTPRTVSAMSDLRIQELAAEPSYIQTYREQLKADLRQLEDGLRICDQYNNSYSGKLAPSSQEALQKRNSLCDSLFGLICHITSINVSFTGSSFGLTAEL
jgi:hypothetical protein